MSTTDKTPFTVIVFGWQKSQRQISQKYHSMKRFPLLTLCLHCPLFAAGLGKESWLAGRCHGWPWTASDRPRANQGQTACQLGTEDSSAAGPDSGRTYQDPKEKRAQAWQQGSRPIHTHKHRHQLTTEYYIITFGYMRREPVVCTFSTSSISISGVNSMCCPVLTFFI